MPCNGIFIVEDDGETRPSLKDILEFEGYLIHEAMNGWEFIKTFKKTNSSRNVPVVVLTAAGLELARSV